jgi:hypothetical protein
LFGPDAPATAEIDKFMCDYDGKLGVYFQASSTVPEDWIEDAGEAYLSILKTC